LPRAPDDPAQWGGATAARGAGRGREDAGRTRRQEAAGLARIERNAAAAVNAAAHQAPLAEVSGKVAFVTGGSSGIGLGLARAVRAAGMKVAFSWRREDHREQALELLGRSDPDVLAIRLD